MRAHEERPPGLHEVVAVWILFAVVAVAVLVTYARVPLRELYNVDEGGLAGGAGRALVFSNYPAALMAIGVLPLVAARLRRRWATWTAVAAGVLCTVVVWPGVVDQDDLDARLVNAVPAVGVLLALVLTALALRRGGLGSRLALGRMDAVRALVAAVVIAASIPWVLAELGFSPALHPVFQTGQPSPEPGHPELIAVHLGHHHGMDGALLALAALLLSRRLPGLAPRASRGAGLYLALMLAYGLANALEDFWLEQLVKRGATGFELPSMIRPAPSPAWAGIAAGALLIHLATARVWTFRQTRTGGG